VLAAGLDVATAGPLAQQCSLQLAIGTAAHPPAHFALRRRRECAQLGECARYASARAAGKPVYNIEYDEAAFTEVCGNQGALGITTIYKVRP
jgi:hypothetical protein